MITYAPEILQILWCINNKKNIRFYASLVHYVQNYYSIFGKITINDNT